MNFPYFFPNSKFLQKKSWHKFIWLVSTIYAGCSLYSVFVMILILFDRLGLINIRGVEVILTLPILIPLFPLIIFTSPEKSFLIGNSFVDNYLGLLLLMAYFAFSAILPSIIYRILLNGIYGQKWQR